MRRMYVDRRTYSEMLDVYKRSYLLSYISVNENFRSRYIQYLLSLEDCALRSGKLVGCVDACPRIVEQHLLSKSSCLCG